jgi:sulfite exporter TauE/SafE/copper chaperone CopZ
MEKGGRGVALKTRTMKIGGMTCTSCQQKIQKKLENTAGVKTAEVSYGAGTATVTYDTDILSYADIVSVIQRLGYEALPDTRGPRPKYYRAAGLLLAIAALYLLLEHFGVVNLLSPGHLAQKDMTYPMLFGIGLITSVHCVAMCGGITLTQTLGKTEGGRYAALKPAALYNIGRVISYTAVGFLVGALGSTITFSNTAQGVLKLIAGVFMVIMGLNMLGIFPWLRRLTPRIPAALSGKLHARGANKGPLVVGLLNGLMPCGPLQAMQIYALSTGSPYKGALSMLLFSLGTVPLMFGLGALSSLLSQRFARRVMTAGAVLAANDDAIKDAAESCPVEAIKYE